MSAEGLALPSLSVQTFGVSSPASATVSSFAIASSPATVSGSKAITITERRSSAPVVTHTRAVQ